MATIPSSTSADRLRAALARHTPLRRPADDQRRAAVLVPILLAAGGPELLFLVRPETLSLHQGQPAFPGGAIDPDDPSPSAAALREAEEELGIPRDLPEVIGALDELVTHTGFHVTPIVALLPAPLSLTPSPAEVAAVFQVPLSRLADPREQRFLRGLRRPARQPPGGEVRLPFWVFTPATIWGATAQMTANLLSALEGSR